MKDDEWEWAQQPSSIERAINEYVDSAPVAAPVVQISMTTPRDDIAVQAISIPADPAKPKPPG